MVSYREAVHSAIRAAGIHPLAKKGVSLQKIRKHVSSTGLEGDSHWVLAALRTEVDAGVLVKPGGSTASYKFAPGGK